MCAMGDFFSILGKTLNSIVVVVKTIAPIVPISRIVDMNSFFQLSCSKQNASWASLFKFVRNLYHKIRKTFRTILSRIELDKIWTKHYESFVRTRVFHARPTELSRAFLTMNLRWARGFFSWTKSGVFKLFKVILNLTEVVLAFWAFWQISG